MNHPCKRTCVATAVAVLAVGVAAHRANAGSSIHIKQNLSTTGVDPDASGQVQAQISSPRRGMRAKLDVKVRHLDSSATYAVVLNGVNIGTLTTTSGGNAHARFTSQPRRRDQLLGTDPRGAQIEVRNASGDGVLETQVPDDTIDPTHVRCCLAHSGDDNERPECEDRTPEACTTAGGANLGAGSCLPNPCESTTPQPPTDNIVCCTPEDDGQSECETRSSAKCSEHHGVNLGAGSCDPNPCTSTVPSTPETVRCCLADDHEVECEHRTAELCTTQGGTNMGAGACSPNPCASQTPVDTVRCCLATDAGGSECEQRRADQCTAQSGTNAGAGSCDANPCGSATPFAGDRIRCCLPHRGDDNEHPECEHRSAAQCAAQGGTNVGAGSCDAHPCG